MNQKMLECLQTAMLRELGEAIKQNNPDFDPANCTTESIFENIRYIYDEIKEKEYGQETGRVLKFMPKRYKEMVMRLISPECAFSYRNTVTDTAVSIDAFLFLDREDNKPVATGTATVAFSLLESERELSEFEIKRMAEAVAKGQAESKALQKFGIGSWFPYEMEEEKPEVMLETAKQKASLSPTLPCAVAKEPEKTAPTPVAENTEKPKAKAKAAAPDNKVADKKNVDPDALQKARTITCDVGKGSGLTLGQLEEKYPGNIVWLFRNPACAAYKDELRLIIENNDQIKDLALRQRVVFD